LFPKVVVNDLQNYPIKNIPLSEQQPFIEKADFMLEKNKELQEKINRFLNRLKSSF
jgi:ABC-type amino acid transport substrate-binding protein